MLNKNKKGQFYQSGVLQSILIGVIAILVLSIGIFSLLGYTSGDRGIDVVETGIGDTIELTNRLFSDWLGLILGFGNDSSTNFLIVLTFILVFTIIIGTMDSVNIFGEDGQGKLINFIVGLIVTLIGIRFMPEDIWVSLTAPPSAFVATILVGIPFLALFFVTMKVKFPLVRKLLWAFYLIFMTYLIFMGPEGQGLSLSNDFAWIYIIFLIAAGILMAFDSTVRSYILTEKKKLDLARGLSAEAIKRRAEIQLELKDWIKLRREVSKGDRSEADAEIKKLKEEYARLGKDFGN